MLAFDSALASVTAVTSDIVVIPSSAIFYFILQKENILHSLHTF